MGRTVITFDLSDEGIDHAIAEIRRFEQELERRCNKVIQELLIFGQQAGEDEAVALGINDTGELATSMRHEFNSENRIGTLMNICPYAGLVEYGTGVRGMTSKYEGDWWPPNGVTAPDGRVYTQYRGDLNGWVYYNERVGGFRRTTGLPSRPFFYRTKLDIINNVHPIAKSVFRGWNG